MAIFEIVTMDVKPGRMDEVVAHMKDLRSICQRIDTGLTSLRVANTVVAGDDSGKFVMIFEHTDLAAWGASIDAEENDPEFLALGNRYGSDPPTTNVSRAILKEIEL